MYIEGTAAPSKIVSTIQETGRDAILRGSGKTNSRWLVERGQVQVADFFLGAAVCILETHANGVNDPVRGLARMVEVSPSTTLVDLTIRGLPAGSYHATVRETGDISRGASSTGGIWEALKKSLGINDQPRGVFGAVEVGKNGKGSTFLNQPVSVWELVGRSMVVSRPENEGKFEQEDPDTLVGVIARSAGVWDNDKTVCSCSGKTIWEEHKEQVDRGLE